MFFATSLVVENSTWHWKVEGFTPDWLIPKTVKMVLIASLLVAQYQLLKLEGLDHGVCDSWEQHSCCLLFPQALVKCGKQISHLGTCKSVLFFSSSAYTPVTVFCNFLFCSYSHESSILYFMSPFFPTFFFMIVTSGLLSVLSMIVKNNLFFNATWSLSNTCTMSCGFSVANRNCLLVKKTAALHPGQVFRLYTQAFTQILVSNSSHLQSLSCGKKYFKRIHSSTGRAGKLHAEMSQLKSRPGELLLPFLSVVLQ